MAKKRERLDIIRDILVAVRDNRQIKPTRLLYASNLSPQMFKDYINELIKKDFLRIEEKEDKKAFFLTKKGYDFLNEYRMIEKFIENFGL